MFTRTFHPDRFLRSVYGTQPFADYCARRGLPFEQTLSAPLQASDARRWTAVLAQLSHDEHARVELELTKVNEMAGRDALAHLLEAAGGEALPPDSVPGGAPLALWYFLHQAELFHQVFLHHEIRELHSWRTAQAAPGLGTHDLAGRTKALATALREFFRLHEGTAGFCTADAYRLREAVCFVGQVADRLQFLEAFTDGGKLTSARVRPALPVLFVYYPADGRVCLKSHLRSRDRTSDLFQRFGQAILGSPVTCDDRAFDLDLLLRPFHPVPDEEDMDMIRLKTLHLRYPERAGRRLVKLETLVSDEPDALEQLLDSHLQGNAREQLCVCYAELQVRLRVDGGSKNYLIRLWPDRCNLNQTPLGDRFRACLQRWGLSHAAKP